MQVHVIDKAEAQTNRMQNGRDARGTLLFLLKRTLKPGEVTCLREKWGGGEAKLEWNDHWLGCTLGTWLLSASRQTNRNYTTGLVKGI